MEQSATRADVVFGVWRLRSPNRQFFHCVQGIANLAENGPDDGGLMVLQGSKEVRPIFSPRHLCLFFARPDLSHFPRLPFSQLYNEVFAKFSHQMPADGWTDVDSYHHTPEMLDWLVNEKGCTWHKVCAGPGDLILWDSRTVHYGAPPKGPKARTAVYVAYKPASLITEEKLEQRKQAMEHMWTTVSPSLLCLQLQSGSNADIHLHFIPNLSRLTTLSSSASSTPSSSRSRTRPDGRSGSSPSRSPSSLSEDLSWQDLCPTRSL